MEDREEDGSIRAKPIDTATEEFDKKLSIKESPAHNKISTVELLREFLSIQQRRAEAYSKLKSGFARYIDSSSSSSFSIAANESAYQILCADVTQEFNSCSKHVLHLESVFLATRPDLAHLLRAVQTHEKHKLNLTATIQLLKKAGRPSERLVTHENCKFEKPREHQCVHLHEMTEAEGTEEAEADVQYDSDLNDAIRGVQDSVTAINEHLEEVRYEIMALEDEMSDSLEESRTVGGGITDFLIATGCHASEFG